MANLDIEKIPVAILCGGRGIYFNEGYGKIAKALVKIGTWPIIFHIIESYYIKGFKKFILASGFQTEKLEEVFRSHPFSSADIKIIYTGLDTTTGDRIKQIRSNLDKGDLFGLTYSDTLSDVPLDKVCEHHMAHGLIGTLVAAHLPTRFRILGMCLGEDIIRGFTNRPVIENDWINGGYYFFNKEIFSETYLGREGHGIVLEQEILEDLARHKNMLAFKHHGIWQHLDNDRDLMKLRILFKELKG